jgi:hypothetical protein
MKFEVLSKEEDRKSGIADIVSAAAVPGGVVLRTVTSQREQFSEATVFLPGVRVDGGKLVPVAPAVVDYFDPNYLKNLVADAVNAAKIDLPQAGSQDCSALIDAAIAKLPTPAAVVLPDFNALVADAVSKLPAPAAPELPDFAALVAAEVAKIPAVAAPTLPNIDAIVADAVAKIPAPAPVVLPDFHAIAAEAVAAEFATLPVPVAPQLPDFDAMITEKVAAAVAAIPKPVEPAPTDAPAA